SLAHHPAGDAYRTAQRALGEAQRVEQVVVDATLRGCWWIVHGLLVGCGETPTTARGFASDRSDRSFTGIGAPASRWGSRWDDFGTSPLWCDSCPQCV